MPGMERLRTFAYHPASNGSAASFQRYLIVVLESYGNPISADRNHYLYSVIELV